MRYPLKGELGYCVKKGVELEAKEHPECPKGECMKCEFFHILKGCCGQ